MAPHSANDRHLLELGGPPEVERFERRASPGIRRRDGDDSCRIDQRMTSSSRRWLAWTVRALCAALLLAGGLLFAARGGHLGGAADSAGQSMENELADARSPYLRSAAEQPVAWQQWGPEAFELAKALDRPVWLDIGAIWCHWCHVMDRESYENPEIAALINEYFVPIKVDRDERPRYRWSLPDRLARPQRPRGRLAADDVSRSRRDALRRRHVLPSGFARECARTPAGRAQDRPSVRGATRAGGRDRRKRSGGPGAVPTGHGRGGSTVPGSSSRDGGEGRLGVRSGVRWVRSG